ncbi:glycosyltransferase [Candidatus Collierbacteria bacterium]|nr:glycosyltransferase [Candidatus Collierbacteria bacterium]MBI3443153.1 glycosyltransferase [Candidatus Woesebacteria bacterium]
MPKLSAIVIGQNVADEVIPAFKTLKFADEIIFIHPHTGSIDETEAIAKKYAQKIVKSPTYDFSKWRNDGAEAASGEWLLYLDSDERIPKKLAEEIERAIYRSIHNAYTIPRYEIFLGKHLAHWPHPRVLRLIKKNALKGWQGKLHEQPKIEGTVGSLKEQMVHLSHKNIDEKIEGTVKWSRLEAEMLIKANHPQMRGWRFFRIMATEFWQRFFKQGLWRDGTEGIIEVIYQIFSVFVTYERLWEMQRKPSLKETYNKLDKKILEDWEKN